jgi:hypothetical protein
VKGEAGGGEAKEVKRPPFRSDEVRGQEERRTTTRCRKTLVDKIWMRLVVYSSRCEATRGGQEWRGRIGCRDWLDD